MQLIQYYLDCLSQASYLVADESTGRAVVVDPRRDVEIYLADAAALGVQIELIVETHFHADFLSGHLELAAATGAPIAYGAAATTDFPIRKLADGERIDLGEVALEVLATPGHTPESISLVVFEHAGDEIPYGVLTGDALFIGDVGRPDLLAAAGVSAEDLARHLYRSLHDKLLALPDATRVYPAHGAGSACGRNLSTETSSTIGEQRLFNYAVQPMAEDDFVALITEGQPAAPTYFAYDAALNRSARPLLDEHAAPTAMTLDEVLAAQLAGALVVDTRTTADFAAGHLRGAIQVGLDTRFAEYAGSVLPANTPIVVTGAEGSEAEAKVRLARIGFDNVVGHLPDLLSHLAEHPDLAVRTSQLTAAQLLERRVTLAELQVIDVRNPGEVATGSLDGSRTLPLATLRDHLGELDNKVPIALYCAGGTRSMIAASLLEQQGFGDVSSVLGGYDAISREVAQKV